MHSYGVSRVSKNSENLYLSGVVEFSLSTRFEERLERFLRPKSVNFWLEFSFSKKIFQKCSFRIGFQFPKYLVRIGSSYSKWHTTISNFWFRWVGFTDKPAVVIW